MNAVWSGGVVMSKPLSPLFSIVVVEVLVVEAGYLAKGEARSIAIGPAW
jgi:hypothetical protein